VRHRSNAARARLLCTHNRQPRRYLNRKEWPAHPLPFTSYARYAYRYLWTLLLGLAGSTRYRPMTKVRALWLPITLSKAPPPLSAGPTEEDEE